MNMKELHQILEKCIDVIPLEEEDSDGRRGKHEEVLLYGVPELYHDVEDALCRMMASTIIARILSLQYLAKLCDETILTRPKLSWRVEPELAWDRIPRIYARFYIEV
jgi:hypothetical protein